jgi:hypothetical protein
MSALSKDFRHIDVWRGTYRGVGFEINHWEDIIPEGLSEYYHQPHHWTYYLFISPDRIPDKELAEQFWLPPQDLSDAPGRVHYQYSYDTPVADLNWHCGITFYEKLHGFDGAQRVIKAGCDYSHYWDEGKTYDISLVTSDVYTAIDSFKEMVPDYKWLCRTVGGFWLPSEGLVSPDGNDFISKAGIEWYEEHYPGGAGWWKVGEKNG